MRIDLTAAPRGLAIFCASCGQRAYAADEVEEGAVRVDACANSRGDGSHPATGALTMRIHVWNQVNDADARLDQAMPVERAEQDR